MNVLGINIEVKVVNENGKDVFYGLTLLTPDDIYAFIRVYGNVSVEEFFEDLSTHAERLKEESETNEPNQNNT